ncbi:MAG TPA: hypothetical protein VN660_10105 [Steroidobacteraceae bacterium]|nr:hypothetical protein [Steroidobacteraceae bacterium]
MRNFKFNPAARIMHVGTLALLVSLAALTGAYAQDAAEGPGAPTPSAKAAAPIDLTGYWESMITYEWEIRMLTPRPGDHDGVPLKPAAMQIMNAWDPAKDTAAGQQCKSYGAPLLMRLPERLHITWQDDQTLKLETDAGEQTRLFRFTASAAAEHGPRTWQGYSLAEWHRYQVGARGSPGSDQFNPGRTQGGELKVITTNLKAGYIRKNGIPYSESTKLLEYYDVIQDGSGSRLIMLTSDITDPVYLYYPYISTSQFLQQPSAAGWEPSACSAIW